MRIILLGPPGAGKGTQSVILAEKFSIPIISTGNILRQYSKKENDLGIMLKQVLDSGKLVEDSLIIKIVKDRLSQADCKNGFLLDGFPRTITQAEALHEAHIDIDHVIELKMEDMLIVKRMSGRRIHLTSGRTYHVIYQPPKIADRDDITGETLVQRDDDQEEIVKARLAVYHKQTEPVVNYYKEYQGINWFSVDANQSVQKVAQEISSFLTTHKI